MKLKYIILSLTIVLLAVFAISTTSSKKEVNAVSATDITFDPAATWKLKVGKSNLELIEKLIFINDESDDLVTSYNIDFSTPTGTFDASSDLQYFITGDNAAKNNVLVINNDTGGNIIAPANSSFLFSRWLDHTGINGDIYMLTMKEIHLNEVFKVTQATTNMDYMFYALGNIEYIDTFVGWDVTQVTSMYAMFAHALRLKYLDLSPFVTTNVENFGAMFLELRTLNYLNISNFSTVNATDMTRMFHSISLGYFDNGAAAPVPVDTALHLDISNFNLNNIVDTEKLFMNTNQIINSIKVPNTMTAGLNIPLPAESWTDDGTPVNPISYFEIDAAGNKVGPAYTNLGNAPKGKVIYNALGQHKFKEELAIKAYAQAIKDANPNLTAEEEAAMDAIVKKAIEDISLKSSIEAVDTIITEAEVKLDKINSVNNLTQYYEDIKANNTDLTDAQLAALEAAKNTAITNVGNATSSLDVEAAETAGIVAMDQILAKAEIEQHYKDLILNADPIYTPEQLLELNAAKDAAITAIEGATTSGDVTTALNNGIIAMDKVNGNKQLEDHKNELKEKYPNLDTSQFAPVEGAFNTAVGNVNGASTSADITTDVEEGIIAMDKAIAEAELNDYFDNLLNNANPALTAAQQTALETARDNAINAVRDPSTATSEDIFKEVVDGKFEMDKIIAEKNLEDYYNDLKAEHAPISPEYETALDQALADAKQDVVDATTSEGVNTSVTNGKEDMDLIIDKVVAEKELEDYYNDLKTEHAPMSPEYEAALDQALADAKEDVAGATTSEGVNTSVTNGKEEMDSIIDKVEAEKELNDYYDKLLDENKPLTPEQEQALEDARDDAIADVKDATTSEELTGDVTNGKVEMDKVIANKELEDYYDDLKEKNPDLTDEQLADLDKALADAKEDVNNATNNSDIDKAVSNGKVEMDKSINPFLDNLIEIIPLIVTILFMMIGLLVTCVVAKKIQNKRLLRG